MRDTKEKKNKWNVQGIRWTEAMLCLVAFICARVGIDGVFYTIGVSFLGSLLYFRELKTLGGFFAILGLISLGSFNIGILKYILMMGLLIVIRGYYTVREKQPTLFIQGLCVGSVLLVINMAAYMIQGMSLYHVGLALLEACVGGALTVLFGKSVAIIRDNRKTPLTTKEAIGMMLLLACVLAGMVDLYLEVPYFQEIYLRDVLTFIIIGGVIYLGGLNLGVTTTMVIGTVLVLIRYMPPQFIGIYGMASMLGGVFIPVGRVGVLGGMGIGLMLGFSVFNSGKIDLQIIAAYLIASMISLIIPKKYFGFNCWFNQQNLEESERTHLLRVQTVITDRLKHIVSAFEILGQTLEEMERPHLKLSEKDIDFMIHDAAEKNCLSCSMKQFCWQQDLNQTYSMAQDLVATAVQKGYIVRADIPEKFKRNCLGAENFAAVLTSRLDLKKMEIFWHNKLVESKYLAAQQLRAIATTLEGLVDDVEEHMEFNKDAEKELEEKLRAEGIKITEVMVLEHHSGQKEINVYTPYCKKKEDISQKIIDAIDKCLEIRVELEKHTCSETGCSYKFLVANKYHVTAGAAAWAKQKVCGDVHSFMELEDGQYLLALADGMGSGDEAYEESATTIEMLEDFMASGLKKETVVKLINATLLLKSETETFSTMDVTLIDSQTGVAEFLKAGAAASFVLRKGKVLTVSGASLPVGIVKEVDVETQKMQLQDGDMLIMVTDGILISKDDVLGKEGTFKHFILEAGSGNPQYVAEYLLQKSKDLLGVGEEDDMTVVVAKIWKR
ncbi:MAG: stage II sporulation protein E [Cellulosilyticaceae bacterium]